MKVLDSRVQHPRRFHSCQHCQSKWVKAVKGNKDDTKDSKWIGDLFQLGLAHNSFILLKPINLLREYTRHLYKLTSYKSSEKNRIQNAFTVCNVALDAVVSDMFGKSASSIKNYLATADTFNVDVCISMLQGSLKKKSDEVLASIAGHQMSADQKMRISCIQSHLDFVQQLSERLNKRLNLMILPMSRSYLCSAPSLAWSDTPPSRSSQKSARTCPNSAAQKDYAAGPG